MHACQVDSVMSDSLQPCGLQPARLLCLWDFPGKNAGVGCRALLQGIFPTQGSKLGLLHWRQILYHPPPNGSTPTLVPAGPAQAQATHSLTIARACPHELELPGKLSPNPPLSRGAQRTQWTTPPGTLSQCLALGRVTWRGFVQEAAAPDLVVSSAG